jgi:hypothetical protein
MRNSSGRRRDLPVLVRDRLPDGSGPEVPVTRADVNEFFDDMVIYLTANPWTQKLLFFVLGFLLGVILV